MPIENPTIVKLESRKVEIEKQVEVLFKKQQEFSRQSTSVQVAIIELRGELKGVEKLLKLLEK